jgi:hypothetical protein
MAAGDLINKQKADILSAENKAKSVMNVKADVAEGGGASVHPNSDTVQGMKQEIGSGKDEVLAAWEKLHTEQRELLKWPAGVIDPQVARFFDDKRPEQMKFDPSSKEGEVMESHRKRIRTMFPNFMPKLAESIRAKWNEEDVTGEAPKTPRATAAEKGDDMEKVMFNQPIVTWSVSDQTKWWSLMTNFKGRNLNQTVDGTPSTIQVVYLKEDLILLNGVLEIIKAANENATIPRQAAISEISSIMIGKEAHEAKPLELSSGGGGGAVDETAERMKMMGKYLQNMGSGGGNTAEVATADELEVGDPAHLKYVDVDFKPIPASEYRNSVTANQLSEKSWMVVVKRVPVRLRLRVDERRIAEILEKCANAKIPLEVRQITLIGGELPKDDSAAAGGRGDRDGDAPAGVGAPSAAASGAGAASAALDGGAGGGGAAAAAGGAGGGEKTFSSPEFNSHFMVPLEIYGIMKIYTEPLPAALGKTDEAATPVL